MYCMKPERTIFVTNDDGYASKGFAAAIEVASRFGRVIAVAPEQPQSGKSQAITLFSPLYLKKVSETERVIIYSLSGTPVDCVKFAFDHFFRDQHIDLTISGINHGSNAAVNVLYSGTMGAAIESSFYDIPSIGLSILDHDADADFEAAIEYGTQIVDTVLKNIETLDKPLCLNVNIPTLPKEEIHGVKYCRQTRGYWHEDFFRREDPHGRVYYWMNGAFDNHEPEAEDSDEWALAAGYVAVVPVQVDMTAYNQLEKLRKLK